MRDEHSAEPRALGADPAREAAGAPASPAHRAISLVAALGVFGPASVAWGDIISAPTTGVAVIALIAGGLWLVCAIVTANSDAALARLDGWLLALGLLVLVAWAASYLHGRTGYATDEAAFEQGAASLLLHGHDPYGADLTTYFGAFSISSKFATYTMNGGMVSTFGYPALPLLIVAAFVQLTGGGQAVPIADVVVLIIATVTMFKLLPPGWRALAVVVCVGFPVLSNFAVAGLNAIITMAALLPAAHRWTRTGETGALSKRDRLKAVAFGLALATNQLAWFVAPFLLVGIYWARRPRLGRRGSLRILGNYAGLAIAMFAVVNAPFIIWAPGKWLHGVAAPLTQHAIPYGQGLVGLTVFLRAGGGMLDGYNYAAGCLYVALLVVYAIHLRRLARACFVLPAVALFASGRSLSEYWMVLIAVTVVGALTNDDRELKEVARLAMPARWRGPRLPIRFATPLVFLPAAFCLIVSLATPQPLSIRIVSATSNDYLRSVSQLRVAVHNGSDVVLRPHFATNVSGQATGFWTVTRGPRALAPHADALYVLSTRDPSSMPANGSTFLLQAVTAAPRTISSSVAFSQRGLVPGNW